MPARRAKLDTAEYRQLADLRCALRRFLRFSEAEAERRGLSAQHYQALLILRARPEERRATINDLARDLMIRHNSAVGLVDRLSREDLVRREPAPQDRRKVHLRLTARGERLLEALAGVHREELRRIGPQLEALLHEIATASSA